MKKITLLTNIMGPLSYPKAPQLLTLLIAMHLTSCCRGSLIATLGNPNKQLGKCPSVSTMPVFSKPAFDGDWYVQKQYNNTVDGSWTCKKLTYSTENNGFTYSYKENGFPWSYIGDYSVSSDGRAVINVKIKFQIALGADSFGQVNQYAVGGDLLRWVILRSCTNYGPYNIPYVYVLTRARTPSTTDEASIADALALAGLPGQLYNTVHLNC